MQCEFAPVLEIWDHVHDQVQEHGHFTAIRRCYDEGNKKKRVTRCRQEPTATRPYLSKRPGQVVTKHWRLLGRAIFAATLVGGSLSLAGCHVPPIVPALLAPTATRGTPVLETAAETDDVRKAKELLQAGADVNVQDRRHYTPLMKAVMTDHRDMVALLLAHGANVNEPYCSYCMGMNGATPHAPMCILCLTLDKDMATLLIAHGADVKAYYGPSDGTALDWASENGRTDLAELYLAHGADVNSQRSGTRSTPLFFAVSGNKKDMVRFLIAHGANVNARDMFGRTPLYTVRSGAMVELLLERGADLNVKDKYGQTPLQAILTDARRQDSCIRKDGKTVFPGCEAAVKARQDVVRVLIGHGAK